MHMPATYTPCSALLSLHRDSVFSWSEKNCGYGGRKDKGAEKGRRKGKTGRRNKVSTILGERKGGGGKRRGEREKKKKKLRKGKGSQKNEKEK